MSTQAIRSARIEARISPEMLTVVKRAAEIQGRSVSEFVVSAAHEAAQKTIEGTEVIRLSPEDSRRFAELILNPPPLTPAMRRAKRAYERLVVQP